MLRGDQWFPLWSQLGVTIEKPIMPRGTDFASLPSTSRSLSIRPGSVSEFRAKRQAKLARARSPRLCQEKSTRALGHCHIYRIYCLLLASVAGPVLMKSTTQRFSLRPKNRLYLLNVTKPIQTQAFGRMHRPAPMDDRPQRCPWWPHRRGRWRRRCGTPQRSAAQEAAPQPAKPDRAQSGSGSNGDRFRGCHGCATPS